MMGSKHNEDNAETTPTRLKTLTVFRSSSQDSLETEPLYRVADMYNTANTLSTTLAL